MISFRYNDYQHDVLSRCNCTPPYSGENAISARSDLNPANGKYPFGALGHRQHGGTDAKVNTCLGPPYFSFSFVILYVNADETCIILLNVTFRLNNSSC